MNLVLPIFCLTEPPQDLQEGPYHYPQFTDEDSETQRGEVTHPGLSSWEEPSLKPGLSPRSKGPRKSSRLSFTWPS